MINWTKLLQVRLETEEDAPLAIRQIAESLPDNMLLRMLTKCEDKGHKELASFLKDEAVRRGLGQQ